MQNQFLEIEKEVFSRRPVLKEIAGKFQDISLKDYVQRHWEIPGSQPEEVFVNVLKSELQGIYGDELAQKAASQILKKPLVSTIDHLGIWNHPIFVNSDLIYSLHFTTDELALVLATESVSLNNTSSWSASFMWHNQTHILERCSFFADRLKILPVFSTPALELKDIAWFHKQTGGRFEALTAKLKLSSPLKAENFSVQACLASFHFWQTVFPSAPKLVYLPLETIISKYLLQIFEDSENFLSKIILTAKGRQLWAKHFSKEHTFMFWGIDAKGRRQVLTSLPENRSEVIELIKKRKIYPSSPLCFAVLLKVGLACVGGFTQTTWLTEVKGKILSLLSEMEVDKLSFPAVNNAATKNFAESSLAWLEFNEKYIVPSAVDIYEIGRDCYQKYSKLAEKITLGQSMKLAMPSIYSVVVPKAKKLAGFNVEESQTEAFKSLGMGEILAELD